MPSKEAKPASSQIESVVHRLVNDEPLAHFALRNLDVLIGGVKKGRVTILPGEPGAGKTTLMNQCADDLASQGIPILFFSYEIDPAQLIAKSLSRLSDGALAVGDIAGCTSDPGAKAALDAAIERYRKFADNVYYYSDTSLTTMDISVEIGRFEREHGRKPVVFVDYVQAVPAPEGVKTADERIQIKATMAGLRHCANSHNVAVFAASSVGREHYEKQTTGLKCLGGSSSLEYGSDGVLFLAVEGKGAERARNLALAKRPVIVSALKNRYGALGSVRLSFDPAHAQFTDH